MKTFNNINFFMIDEFKDIIFERKNYKILIRKD